MKQHLENIATDQGWAFKYARPDYLAGDNGADTPNNMEAGTIALFCDPIEKRPDLNNEGTRQGFRYVGRFMLLEKSEIDETYANKYDNYIEQMIAYLEVLERELACQGIELIGWRWEEIINEHWSNMDGVLVNFEARVWDTTAPEIVTTLTLTNANQEITLTNPITAAVGTANKPSRFFLMGNTEGLTLTVNSEIQATITGTPTANTNAVLVARGKFGGFQVVRLNITFLGAGNFIDLTINGDTYDTVSDDTDIPVINSEDTEVGSVVGSDVVIGDSDVRLTLEAVEVAQIDVPAEKLVNIPIDTYIPDVQFEVNDVDVGDIDPLQTTGIDLVDTSDDPVTPDSVTQIGNKFKVVAPDADITDSGIYSETVEAGGSLVLPDRTLTIKRDTVTVDTITYPAMENQDVEVTDYSVNALIAIEFYNGGDDLTTGVKDDAVQFAFSGTVVGWEIFAYDSSDALVSASAVVDILSDSFANLPMDGSESIAGSDKPTLSSQTTASDDTITFSALEANNYIQGEIESISAGVAKIVVVLKIITS